jgi:membrane fusion protein (multidrug efflux system)
MRAEAAPVAEVVSAVGSLRANESVEVVSELSRRLVKVLVDEGAQVEAGQPLFQLDDTVLRAEIAEIDARMNLAIASEQRNRELSKRNAISQQALDETVAAREAIKAEREAKAAELAKSLIRAPFAGRVGLRRVSEGAWVTPSTPLIGLHDLSKVKIDFQVPARYANDVRVGQKFTFRMAGDGREWAGSIAVIEPRIDESTRSLRVRGVCDNRGGALFPGAFVEVALPLERQRAGFAIPSYAVVPGVRGHGVYVARDGKAEWREVEIGARTADAVSVVRGLEAGETVLTSNLVRIRPGAAVEVVPAVSGTAR